MMNNNKILTVSYGTFSCTLEGFEDSFGTMKAIAEYFRDLAADDRYFGAEPPQPDAEMLARIAQKEISRRVEAREHEGRIVLSAHEEQPAMAAPAALAAGTAAMAAGVETPVADVPREEPLVEAGVETEAVAEETMADLQTPEAEEAPVEPAVEEAFAEPQADVDMSSLVSATVSDSIAAEETASAAWDDATVEEADHAYESADDAPTHELESADEEPQLVDAVAEADEIAEDEPAEEAAEDDAFALTAEMSVDAIADADQPEDEVAAEMHEDAAEVDIVPNLPDDDVEAFFGDASSDAPDFYEGEEALDPLPAAEFENVDPAPAARPSSIAEKLKRIRAVVSRHQEADDDPDYTEDEHAEPDAVADAPSLMEEMAAIGQEDATDGADDVMSSALRDLNNALMEDDEAEAEALQLRSEPFEDFEDENDDVTDILNRLDRADEAEATEEDALADEDSIIFDDSLVGDLMADTELSDDDAEEPALAENLFGDDAEEEAQDSADADTAEAETVAPRARVIKVKRVELEAAISSGALEEFEDEADDSSLSEQAEAELARELAAVEAELEDDPFGTLEMAADDDAEDTADADEIEEELAATADDADDVEELEEELHSAARDMLPSIDDDQDSDISRLLAETNSQMGDEESAGRRDAFAHLRAAVAAKKADVEAGGDDQAADEDGAYRDDLASVVRPRRPATSAGRTARPNADARPAPLKLVAEQRIDVDQVRSSGPVRPRRVAAMEDAASVGGDAGSFAEFAADMGASKLPDLLEAAAAYMSFVEGREQFSRPQLMTKVRQVEMEDFSREDSLRSFGKLLRDGKIEKIKGGRFQVSEQIGFRPDEREAG